MFLKKILLTLTILLSLPATSSNTYRRYDVTTGLSENSVLDIIQDADGYMWFATKDGLNKFNGNSFIKYTAEQESNVLNIERICMHSDSVRIWVASTRRLYLFDPQTEEFTPFQELGGNSYNILCLQYDDSGSLWLGAKDRVFRWDEDSSYLAEYNIRPDKADSDFTRVIFKDSRGNIWIGTQYGLRNYITGKDRFSDCYTLYPEDRGRPDNEITAIAEETHNRLWIGTRNGDFGTFNINTKEFTLYQKEFELGRIHVIFDFSDTELIIGGDNGMFLFNKYTHNWSRSRDELGRESIYDCFRDREGGLWIGTYFSGVNYLSPKYSEIEWYYDDGKPGCLNGNAVSQFCEDPSGNIWIATENGGLNYFNIQTKYFTSFQDKTYTNLHSLYLDGDKLWIGTFSQGLDIMDVQTGKVKKYRKDISDSTSIPNDHIYSIYKTTDGSIYVGTLGGLCKYNNSKDNFSFERDLGQAFIFDIAEDSLNNIWIATKGRGIWKKPERGQWQKVRTPANQSDRFNRIYIDDDSNVWFCSEDSGIYRYDNLKDSLINYSYRQNLPRCTYYGIIDDGNGYLWLSSNSGIIKYNPDSWSIQIYTIENGLQSNQFNYKSSMKSSDGKFWFGGINGFNCFYPQDLTVNTIPPNVKISSVTMPLSDTLDASQRIIAGDRIDIPYNTPYFTINFESLSFVAPGQNLYAWKISGLHKDWNYTRFPYVSLTGLSSGHYHFVVKGSNNDGYWSKNIAELEVHIKPAPYLTIWAKFCYFILILLLLWYALTKWNRISEERKKQELTQAKMEFFTHIAHEIKTSVTLISAPLERITEKKENNPEKDDDLQIMRNNVDRLLDLVKQFLDFRKIDKTGYSLQFVNADIKDLTESVINRFRAHNRNIVIIEDISATEMTYNVNPEAFVKILTNLLSNAFSYAKSEITVKLAPDILRDGFILSVTDDGMGIPPETGDKVFEPFYQISPSAGKGFGIGLSIVRLLVEKHGGTVEVNRQYRNGCQMIVRIPAIDNNKTDYIQEKETIVSKKHEWAILIVEDTDDLRRFISSGLSDSYDIYSAHNGREALELLSRYPIDLVISDIMMPELDGFGLLESVRKNEVFCYLPFILLSALDSVDDKIRGLEYGADAYIEKPFTLNYLKACISSIYENRKRLFSHFASDPEFQYDKGGMNAADTKWIEKINSIIRDNLNKDKFNIDMLATEMAMSRSNLHRRLKGITGSTPNEYIKIFRLKTAASMLRQRQYRVNEICDLVGFYNRSYFAKCFYEQFGIHPKDYMKRRISGSDNDEVI